MKSKKLMKQRQRPWRDLDAPEEPRCPYLRKRQPAKLKNCEFDDDEMYQEMLRLEQCHNLVVDDSPTKKFILQEIRYCEDHG
jgi:hypothetical protein